ncbi:SDR family NAD(P)-dependent oxidoreductase [Acinetobacter sp. ANC 3781]
MQTILIVGATSSIAQACMHVWAQTGQVQRFICIARNPEKLALFTQDFSIRYPKIHIDNHSVAFDDLALLRLTIEQCFAQKVDQALLAQGTMFQDERAIHLEELTTMVNVNMTSMAALLSDIYKYMHLQGAGKIGVIGSVAGDRGRNANYLYGASKAFIATYAEGLQHRAALEKSAVTVSLIKPGPTASAMTQHLVASGKKLANIHEVAQEIVMGMQKGKRVIYTPKIWRIIMLIIRHIPFFVFKKIDI